MRIGKDFQKAREQAQANADFSGQPRWLFLYNGEFRLSKTAVTGSGFVRRYDPKPKEARYGKHA
jgi:hypothetical protein